MMRYSRFMFVLAAASPFCAAQQAQITSGVASRPQMRTGQPQPRPGVPPRQTAVRPPQPQAQPAPTPTPAPTPVSLQPMRPSDMPPVPPQVTFRDGMLTVQAINSTMSSLLQAIRSKTGIQFEGGENSPDRVAISVGPAPEGEVLSSIFNGSNFDYVVIGRQDSPAIVQRVILTPHARGGGAGAVVANGQPATPAPEGQTQPGDEQTNPDDQANADADQPQDVPEEPPQVQPTPEPETQQQSNPKTPEQLLQELKELQQQQQQNQNQNPGQAPRKPPQ
jgi:hypothetical protein